MHPATPTLKKEIISLTSLRGVAAMGVVLLHLYPQLQDFGNFSDVTPILDKGYLWVDFFLVLSGFIMCYAYGQNFVVGVTGQNYLHFIRLRLIRIYPLHLATLMVFVAFEVVQLILVREGFISGVTVFSDQSSPFSLVANIFMVHAWGIVDVVGWNQPSWSISAELFAYLLFPFLFVWIDNGRVIMMVIFTLAAVAMLSFIQVTVGGLNTTVDFGVIRGLGGFVAGMVIFYLANHEGRLGDWAINFLQTISFVGILAVMNFGMMEILVMPFFALLILVSSADRGWVGWLCRLRPVYFLGMISYSLYMTHNIITQVFNKRWASIIPELSFIFESSWVWLLVIVELVLIIALAYISYILVEVPSRRWLRQKLVPAKCPS